MTVKLRVLGELHERPLPLAALRAKLGGAAPDACARAGEIVVVDGAGEAGVLLDADPTHAHVWLGEGRVRRVELARVSRAGDGADARLATIAERARAFRDVRLGDRVTVRDRDRDGAGTVADRCRFGVVVARADGTMVGVGFTRVSREPADA